MNENDQTTDITVLKKKVEKIISEHQGPDIRANIDSFVDNIIGLIQDESKRIVPSLKVSEADNLRNILEHISDIIFILDEENVFREVYCSDDSPLYADKNEFLGRNISDILPENVSRLFKKHSLDLRSTKMSQSFEYDLEIDGNTSWFRATLDLEMDGRSVITQVRDITQPRNLDSKYSEKNRQFQLLMDNMSDLVIKFDSEHNIVFVSNSYCETFGKGRDELIGSKFFPLIHEDDRENVKQSLESLSHPPYRTEHRERAYTTAGWRWFEWTAKAEVDAGMIKSITAVGRDISDSKIAELKLKKQYKINEIVFNSSPYLLLLVDENVRVDRINDFALNYVGKSRKDVIGMPCGFVINCNNQNDDNICGTGDSCASCRIRTQVDESLQTGKTISNREGRLVLKSGSNTFKKDFLISTCLLDIEGQKKVLLSMTDITETKEIENKIKRSNVYLTNLIECTPGAIAVLDCDGKINRINANFTELFGYTSDEAIKSHINDLIVPEDKLIEAEHFCNEDEIKELSGKTIETLRINKNREILDVLLTISQIVVDGEYKGVFAIYQDIRQKKQAEKEINQKQKDLIEAQRIAKVGNWLYDIENDKPSWSNEMFRIFGLDIKKGEPSWEEHKKIINSDDWERIDRTIANASGKGIPYSEVFRILHPDSKVIWAKTIGKPIFKNNKVVSLVGTLQDITEQKENELRLNRKNELLEELNQKMILAANSAKFGIWDLDIVNNVLEWDDWMFRLYGLEKDNFGSAYESWKAGVHPDDIEKADREVQMAISGEKEFDTEFRVVWPNGEIRYLKANAIISRDETGRAIRMTGINYDITERKYFEIALKISEEKFARSFENSPLLMTISEIETGKYIDINEKFIEVSGYTREDAIGKTSVEIGFVSGYSRDLLRSTIKNRGMIKGMELNLKRKDGSELIASYNAEIIEFGGKSRLLSIAEDITEKIKNRKLIEEKEARFREIVSSVQDGLIYVNKKMRVIHVNDALIKLTGLKSEELINKNVFGLIKRLISPKKLPGLMKKVVFANKGNSLNAFELEFNNKTLEIRSFYDKNTGHFTGTLRDISDRKEAEEKIRQSREIYRNLVDGLPDIIMRFDRNFHHIFVSENVISVVSMESKEFIGKTHRELGFSEEQSNIWEKAIEKTFKGLKPIETEFELEYNNKTIIFNWRLIPEFDEKNEVISVLTIARDITGLRMAEQKYKMLFNEMLDGFALHEIICDNNGLPIDYRFLDINPAFEKQTGLSRDIVGKTVLEVMPGTEKYWIDQYGKVALTGKPIFFENYASAIDKYFEVTAFRPAPMQFACLFQDITDKKKAQLALEESEKRFREMADMLPEAIFEATSDMTITYANKTAMDLFGYDKVDIDSGINGFDTLDIKDRLRAKEIFSKRILGEETGAFEYQGLRKDGSTFPMLFHMVSIIQNNSITGFRGVIVNITERKRTEEELRKVSKLESLGILAGGIAHNFKNMLTAMSLSVEIAKMNPKKTAKHLDRISKSVEQASALATRFQAFTKSGAPVLQSYNINKIITDASEIAITGTSSIIKKELDYTLPDIMIDKNQMSEVFTNLILNATQAMPNGGNIIIRSSKIYASENDIIGLEAGEYIYIRFEDEGIGIPESKLSEIFTPFYTTKDTGQGLGLSTVYQIVKNHGGTILVSSEVSKGTTFSIYLPFIKSDDIQDRSAKQEENKLERIKKILVIDDDKNITDNFEEIADCIDNVSAKCFNDPERGIEDFSRQHNNNPYDIVILDITLVGYNISGLEILNQLREIDPQIKVIVFSGHSDKPIVANYREYGFNGRLEKPFSIKRFEEEINKLC